MNLNKLAIILLILPFPVMAREKDKEGHLLAGLGIGAVTTVLTGSYKSGYRIGCTVGLLKEISDINGGTPDVVDFLYTCAGALISSYGIHFIMYRDNRKTFMGSRYEL